MPKSKHGRSRSSTTPLTHHSFQHEQHSFVTRAPPRGLERADLQTDRPPTDASLVHWLVATGLHSKTCVIEVGVGQKGIVGLRSARAARLRGHSGDLRGRDAAVCRLAAPGAKWWHRYRSLSDRTASRSSCAWNQHCCSCSPAANR